MEHAVIVTDLNKVNILFNSGEAYIFRNSSILIVNNKIDYCEITIKGSYKSFQLSTKNDPFSGTIIIDTINGIEATDNEDLCNKIDSLML